MSRRIFSRLVEFDLMYIAYCLRRLTLIMKIQQCEVGVEVADKVAGEYSQGKLNLISKH